MNIIHRFTWKAMWKNRTRTLVTIIGILLSTAIFTAITTMAISIQDFLIRGVHYTEGDYYVKFVYADENDLAALSADETVSSIADYRLLGFVKFEDKESSWSSFAIASGDDAFFAQLPVHLEEGRLPENSGELLLPERALEVLNHFEINCKVGDTITLDAVPAFEGLDVALPETDKQAFSKSYTIVGIARDFIYDDGSCHLSSMLTYTDGNEGDALCHHLYAKTDDPQAARTLSEREYGVKSYLNHELLNYLGTSEFDNITSVIAYVAILLIVIVLIGSVGLIYNAFSISLSERTKQIGLLSSVGATRKQLRRSVFFEAGTLSLISIPAGLLIGWGLIALTLSIIGLRVKYLFSPAAANEVALNAVISPLALGSAVLIALFTVFISAIIPAIRATRITPMDAIRQSADYKVRKSRLRNGKLLSRIFGVHGFLASKYFRVSRNKYRTTILSLAISIILFLSATSLGNAIQNTASGGIQTENFDFRIYISESDTISPEELRRNPYISKIVQTQNTGYYHSLTPDSILTNEFQRAWDNYSKFCDNETRHCQPTSIEYLEDSMLEEFLIGQGIDPAPYLTADDPTALVYKRHIFTPHMQDEYGGWVKYSYLINPLKKNVDSITMIADCIPMGLTEQYADQNFWWDFAPYDDALLIQARPFGATTSGGELAMGELSSSGALFFEMVVDEENEKISYYTYDYAAKTRSAEPIYVYEKDGLFKHQKLGAHIDEVPFGVCKDNLDSSFVLILPLSAYDGPTDVTFLSVKAKDYTALKAYLDENEIDYNDYHSEEENNRTLLLLLNVFAYGFIILISLISAANVLSTISTNLALRTRDFAMMRSVGLSKRSLYRIAALECMIYCFRALLIGLPIGLIAHIVIYSIVQKALWTAFAFPWQSLLVCISCVFAITFISILYTLTKMRKANLIDALRNENL